MSKVEELRQKGFAHVHLHTDASHLDGMNSIGDLIKRLKEIGARSCAVTDHGNAHNLLRFYQACLVNDIKPLLGVEVYMSYARQLQKNTTFYAVEEALGDDFIFEMDKSHLVLLAENFEGYQNLCRLVTKSNQEGSYGKPRIDYELLKQYSEGVICINGHVGTDLAMRIERAHKTDKEDPKSDPNHYAEMKKAYELSQWYKDVFGDRYYLEIQNHGLEIEKILNPAIIKMSNNMGVPIVMTNDAHYTWRSDADAHRVHFANGIGQTYEELVSKSDYEGFATCDEFYIKDLEEMLEMALPWGDEAVQALINTNDIVDRCNIIIDHIELKGVEEKKGKLVGKWKTKEYLFPDFPIPMPFNTKEAYFEHLITEGLKERFAHDECDLKTYTEEQYWDRLKYEMGVINNMGFPTYFIILWDLLRFCREEDIPVGKGRGSGAGSLVAYSLRITDIDPLHYDLLFERFLNPHRISMPDIDMDFCYDRIDEVIDYTRKKYGNDRVCKIGTFGTLSAKSAIKDVARVLEYDYQATNNLTTKIQEVGIKIKEILEKYPDFKKLYDEDEEFKRVVDVSRRMEGMQRHTSQHAAGIVISPFPLSDLIPMRGYGVDVTSQFDMVELETLGFVKMDYLRLRTLTIIKNTTKAIKRQLGIDINIDKIDFEDEKVFEQFQHGNSIGIFQFESEGMQALLKKQHPTSVEDLSAVNSLYRPGPLDMKIEDENDPNFGKTMVDIYIARASGEQEVTYDHPLLESIQKPTYGIFVYQEQLMFGSVSLAGYSLPESDELRKVVGKKLMEYMPEQKQKFVNGCLSNPEFVDGCKNSPHHDKTPRELAEFIWSQIETFGRYGFNKSHSTAYATLGYQSMWLKTYYPEFFMASVLTSLIGEKLEKIVPYLNETRVLGLKLLAPDVNQSSLRFEVSRDRKGIHFSLNGIKGVGTKAVENILETKSKLEFKTMVDFILMTSGAVNKTVVTNLASAGAFDFLGYNRRTTVQMAQDLVALSSDVKKKISGNKKRKNPVQDISSFYDPLYNYQVVELEEYPHEELCKMEKDLTGFYMSHHPLEGLISFIQSKATHSAETIANGKYVMTINEDESMPNLDSIYAVDGGESDGQKTLDIYQKLSHGQTIITGGVIKQLKEITIKRGRNQGKIMASFIIEDAYQGDIRCTVFYQQYEQYINTLQEGKVVMLKGNIDYFNDNAQVNVNQAYEVNRHTVDSYKVKDLMQELTSVQNEIALIEETMELLGTDAELILDITSQLIQLYERQEQIQTELEKVDMVA